MALTKLQFDQLLSQKILVMDGAMGTMLQNKNLTSDDFGGEKLEGCNENLVLTRPDVITDIHEAYLKAGADIIETNTFGGTQIVLAEYDLEDKADEINQMAAKLAVAICKKYSTPEKPRLTAGSMGPTTKAISVTGGVTFDQLVENFYQQAKSLIAGGVDLLLLETAQDTRNIKAGLIGIEKILKEKNLDLPVILSGTIEPTGTMLGGQTAESLLVSVSHAPLSAIGLNCATGPEFMTDHIRTLHELSPFAISCYPNAGLPDEDGKYLETPVSLAKQLERFVDHGWINIIGGCCGTTDQHIAEIAKMVTGKKPRKIKSGLKGRSFYSGIEPVEATNDNRPLIVGERTNVIGSRLFKKLVNEEKWEESTDIARRQVKNGAQIIDVCLQSTDRDEIPDIDPFYELLIKKIKAPIMIDTTDPLAIEKALTYCQGKSIINSINLEDGEEKFEKICPIIKKYGSAIVVGTIDEDPHQAQAFTRERKLEIATRSYQLLTTKYQISEEDIIFDPLVFPCATGDENYIGGAVETIEGLRLIKEKYPYSKTTLGVSNISFGLPANAREVINSVFLYYCTEAGLDLAIVNSEKLERFASIPLEEKKLAENLLFNYSTDPSISKDWRQQSLAERIKINQDNISAIANFYRSHQKQEKKSKTELPLDERLAQYIIDGSKDGLVEDLDLKLKENIKPLDIINGPLMSGMAIVGKLFNNNELIVAEVLQSAEAMKTAVSHLEQFMEKSESIVKGKIMLATVKGDVHDIGKNLVEIILTNNGYQVINLGIKVPPEVLINEYKKHKPDIIGLSGLLVKSAQQMTITVDDFKRAGISIPVLVGGAALSDRYTYRKIAPSYTHTVIYAKDAMTGLDLANQLVDPNLKSNLEKQINQQKEKIINETNEKEKIKNDQPESTIRSSQVSIDIEIPSLPYPDRKIRSVPQLEKIWEYINPMMLFVRHLGFKGNFSKKLAERDEKALKLNSLVNEVKEIAKNFMKIKAVWQFYEAESNGNELLLFKPSENQPLHTFQFNRQKKEDGLCLTDYVLPKKNNQRDIVAIFVVGAGEGIKEKSEELKNAGDYLKSHALQALAIETAEATAEWLHQRLREDLGFPDDPSLTMKDRFVANYRGKRYSFGYPACPNLEDQQGIWKLLNPEEIGVSLTEGDMMDPEASVSALVFHHPDCIYFSVGSNRE